jgi:O-antigen/teichoic acid export membrane protein
MKEESPIESAKNSYFSAAGLASYYERFIFLTKSVWRGESAGFERIRRAGLTGMSSMVAQGITILAGFISIPLTVNYLGQERYAVWLAINSSLQFLYISNLGLSGNALINKLSEANGRDDKNLAKEIVSTAFCSLAVIALFFTLIFFVAFSFADWSRIFNTSQEVSTGELGLAVAAGFICFVVMFPTSMVDAVYQSYQEGYIGNILNIAGSIASLIALFAVTHFQGGLPSLVLALFGVRMLFSFANAAYLFLIRHPFLFPSYKHITKKSLKSLTSLGFTYLIAQVAAIGLTQSQPWILIQILGPASVPVFAIAMRIIFLPTTFVQMFISPLMPAYGEAKARGDWKWINKTLKNSVVLSMLATLLPMILLLFFAQPIIGLWLGEKLVPSNILIYGLSIQVFIGSIIAPISVMLYGLEKVRGQAILTILNMVLLLGLGIPLTRMWGEGGLVTAMVAGIFFAGFLGQLVYLYIVYKNDIRHQISI